MEALRKEKQAERNRIKKKQKKQKDKISKEIKEEKKVEEVKKTTEQNLSEREKVHMCMVLYVFCAVVHNICGY